MVAHGKPHPDIYLETAKRLGLRKEDCLVIEDSKNGILAAHAAKMDVIMIPDMIAPDDELKAMCYQVMEKLEDILTVLQFSAAQGTIVYKVSSLSLIHIQMCIRDRSIGDPQKKLKSIHVAGTNGKGSTTNDIRSMLQEAGYCVGSFTSPYMITHLDRIRINDMYMDEKEFIEIANTYYESWLTWDLSMFEIDMMLACIYFERHHVDYAVFEVGLGAVSYTHLDVYKRQSKPSASFHYM